MYMCISIYAYICIHKYKYISIYRYIYTYKYVQIYLYIYRYIYIYIYIYRYIWIIGPKHAPLGYPAPSWSFTCINLYIYISIHTHICIHIYIKHVLYMDTQNMCVCIYIHTGCPTGIVWGPTNLYLYLYIHRTYINIYIYTYIPTRTASCRCILRCLPRSRRSECMYIHTHIVMITSISTRVYTHKCVYICMYSVASNHFFFSVSSLVGT